MTDDDTPDRSGPARPIPLEKTLAELPEKPEGWTRRMTLHLNLGRGAGSGTYAVLDPAGQAYPFAYCYRSTPKASRDRGWRGFLLPGVSADASNALTWEQLRAAWPAWRAEQLSRTQYPT